MERFATLFESHDRQFLVKLDENSDGDAALSITTSFAGAEMSINIGFGDNDEAAKAALEAFKQEQADVFGKKLEGCTTALEAFTLLGKDS
ncbi:hypothetical protein [Rahnella bonaserana]